MKKLLILLTSTASVNTLFSRTSVLSSPLFWSRLVTAGPRQRRSPARTQAVCTTRNWAASLTTEKETTLRLWISSHTACNSTDLKFSNISSRTLDIGSDTPLLVTSSPLPPEETLAVRRIDVITRDLITALCTNAGMLASLLI